MKIWGSSSPLAALVGVLALLGWIAAGLTGWWGLAVAAVMCSVLVAVARVFDWVAAWAIALLVPLLTVQLVTTWSYLIPGVGFDTLIWIFFGIEIIAAVLLSLRGEHPRLTVFGAFAAVAAFAPALASWLVMWRSGMFGAARLGWMLNNDAPFNSLMVRRMVESNGAAPSFTDVPSLVQQAMSAAVATLGIPLAQPGASTVSLLSTQAQVLALLWLACGPVFAGIAFRELATSPRWLRLGLTALAGLYPLSWFLLGNSIGLGFFNVPVAVLGLGLSWVLWRTPTTTSLGAALRSSALWLSVVFVMGAWIPLAVVPLALAVAASWPTRATRALIGHRWMLAYAGAGVFGVYGLAVALPSYLRFGSSLSVNGAMVDFGRLTAVTILCGVALVALLASRRWFVHGSNATGLLIMVAAIAGALVYITAPTRDWTYYPAKLAWIACFVVVFIALLTFWEFTYRSEFARARGVQVAIGATAAVFAMLTLAVTVPSSAALGGGFRSSASREHLQLPTLPLPSSPTRWEPTPFVSSGRVARHRIPSPTAGSCSGMPAMPAIRFEPLPTPTSLLQMSASLPRHGRA